jgi:ribosomal protein L3 glutamine methyltransferase
MLAPVLNLEFSEIEEFYDTRLTVRERKEIAEFAVKRIFEHIPTAYLTNISWFCNIPFYVDERVLIPRSPIGELIKNRFEGYLPQDQESFQILDMCTGSGCIAIATAVTMDGAALVDAVDVSEDAIDVCYTNIENIGVEELVTPIMSDLFEKLEGMSYDLIIANPPYVDEVDLNNMPEEYLHEPRLALESGEDGLDLTIRILREAPKYMKEGAWLICEVGNSMVNLTARYPDYSFRFIEFKNGGNGVFAATREELLSYQF